MEKNEFSIKPVGYVSRKDYTFTLEIFEEFRPALKELEGFSPIQTLFWFNHFDSAEYRRIMISEKPYTKAPDQVGIFATRSPIRPNPLALSVIQIHSVDMEKGLIDIAFTDAEDQTPIIDIKPYHPATDRVKDVSVPDWCPHWPDYYEENATFDWAAEFVNVR